MSKRLYKSRHNRMLCGVCGGIGEYFGVDQTVVRLIFVLLTIFGMSGLLFYLICAIIMPSGY